MLLHAMTLAILLATGSQNDFLSTWKAPGAEQIDFTGRKVAAVLIVDDPGLRVHQQPDLGKSLIAIAEHRHAFLRNAKEGRKYGQLFGHEARNDPVTGSGEYPFYRRKIEETEIRRLLKLRIVLLDFSMN